MHRLRLAVLLTALGGTPPCIGAQTAIVRSADSISAAIDRAYLSGDSARIQDARALAERLVAKFPDDALLQHYLGFALYREATASPRGAAQAIPLLKHAQDVLENSLKTHPLAETHALVASIDGQLIAADRARAMELGMASQRSMAAARELGATNPRVWLLKGQSELFTPAEYGGGPKSAREDLEHAVELFGKDVAKPGEPQWGKAEAHVWLGQVYERLHETALAVAEYQKALEIAPNFNRAKALAAALK